MRPYTTAIDHPVRDGIATLSEMVDIRLELLPEKQPQTNEFLDEPLAETIPSGDLIASGRFE